MLRFLVRVEIEFAYSHLKLPALRLIATIRFGGSYTGRTTFGNFLFFFGENPSFAVRTLQPPPPHPGLRAPPENTPLAATALANDSLHAVFLFVYLQCKIHLLTDELLPTLSC